MSRFAKTAAIVLAAGSLAALPATALAQTQQMQLLQSVSTQDVELAMSRIGGQAVLEGAGENGSPTMRLTFANGIVASAQFACNQTQGCTGINLIAYFPPAETMSVEQGLLKVRRFNANFAAASAGLDVQNNLYVRRYLIFDNGITDQNLLVNLRVFESMCAQFKEA